MANADTLGLLSSLSPVSYEDIQTPGINPGELYNWDEITAPPSANNMYGSGLTASRAATQLGLGALANITGVPNIAMSAASDFFDAKDGNLFSLDNLGELVAKGGVAALGLTGIPGIAASAIASQIDPASQRTRDRNLGLYDTSFIGRTLRSPVPSAWQNQFFGQRDIADRSLNTEYEDIEGVKGTSWDSNETSMDGPGGSFDYESFTAPTTYDSTIGNVDGYNDENVNAGNEAETEDDYDDFDDDQFADGGLAQNSAEPKDTLNLGLASFKASEGAPGVTGSNFNFRTPDGGISLGDALTLTGNYGRSTEEVTPGDMGIPQEVIDRFRLQNQKQKSTSYNVGIRAMFPDGVVPDFMDRILRPNSANVSYGQSDFEKRNTQGDIAESNSNITRGIGGQGQILRGMFGENAPTVGVQYLEPNRNDKNISANMNFSLGDGIINLEAARAINEGRDNQNSFKAGFNYPVGPGTASIEGERTADGESRGMLGYRYKF
mgnify:FL=1